VPSNYLTHETLEEGLGFDGSSYGYVTVEDSDMVFIPDIASAFVDPFSNNSRLNMFVRVYSLGDNEERFSQDPRYIAEKIEDYSASLGIADEIIFGPEYEFYLFDQVAFKDEPGSSGFNILSQESARFNALENGFSSRKGYHLINGYHAAPPSDSSMDYRDELIAIMDRAGFPVKYHHHEVGGAGQLEIEVMLGRLLKMADTTVAVKYLTKNLALKYNKTATFMPKPLMNEAGSGMHVHIKLHKDKKNIFYKKGGYCDLSESAMYFIGGILYHAPALLAFTNPSTNSYKRLIKGYEAPVSIVFGKSNRSSCVRIPGYATGENDKRIEFRSQDATCNPYFAFPALVMAGLDGITKKIDPQEHGFGPYDKKNVFDLPIADQKKIKSLPDSLEKSIKALENDNEFLYKGSVFSPLLVESWINALTKKYVDPVKKCPSPFEFVNFYNC
jgi:glutamine synthetase